MKWLWGCAAALVGALAWRVRGFFADRAEARLKKERDTALTWAKQQGINAEAKAHEAEQRQKQQKREDAVHAADNSDLKSLRDTMFK